jgi:hypothetical protein
MKRFALLGIGALVACGGGGGGDDDGSSATPDVTTVAHMQNDSGVWSEVGPANWSCLGTPSDDVPSTVEINLTGTVIDFQNTEQGVGDAMVSAFMGTDIGGTAIASATADGGGGYSITLPVGVERVAFEMTADQYLPTYLLNQYFQPGTADQMLDMKAISLMLANALPAFINKTRTPGLGVVAGAIRDCDHHEVSGAIATVSSTPSTTTTLDGAETYYFSGGSQSLPVRLSQQAYTNEDGLFMAIELPPTGTAYLQVWGFLPDQDPGSDELTLLAEIPTPVVGDTVITASMEAVRQ